MKKINLTVGILFTSLLNYAQPVIHSSNLGQPALETMTAAVTGFSPGKPGANQIWDFSHLQLKPAGSCAIATPSDQSFATANFCIAYNNPLHAYFYYRQNAEKLELVGEDFAGIGVIAYSNPKTLIEFPYTFGQTINDTYQMADQTISFTSTYDAYGALLLPFGKYTNVIRQKIVENGQTNYIWFNADPFFPILQTALQDNTIGIVKDTAALSAR